MKDWIGLAARLVLGGVLAVAGGLKFGYLYDSVRAVSAYQLLPESIVPLVGYGLPILEVIVGVCLILGLLTRGNAVIAGLLMIAFIYGISHAWANGLKIDCGCFGGGGYDENAFSKYPWEIARDVALLALAAWLVWRPTTKFSLDAKLFPASADESELADSTL